MSEGDLQVFQESIGAFQTYWEGKQPTFISYFKEYYASRVGKY